MIGQSNCLLPILGISLAGIRRGFVLIRPNIGPWNKLRTLFHTKVALSVILLQTNTMVTTIMHDNDCDNNTDRGSGPLVSLNAMTYLIVGNKDNGETKSRSRRQCRGGLLVRALALRRSRPALTTGSTFRPHLHVNSQLGCLRPVGILNSWCCSVLSFFLFCWPWKAPVGSVN